MKTSVAVAVMAGLSALPNLGDDVVTSLDTAAAVQTTAPITDEFKPTDITRVACKLWLRSDLGITLNGSDVSAWADQSGNANNAAQAVALLQPAFVNGGWSNGLHSVNFVRANTEYLNVTVASGSTSNSYSCFAAITQRNPTTNIQMLLSTFGGSADFGPMTPVNPSNDVGILNGGTWRGAAAGDAASGEQFLSWVIDAAATSVKTYRNGVLLGTDATYVPTNMRFGSTTTVGCYRTGAVHNFDGECAELFLYEGVLTAQELAVVHNYLDVRY